MPKSKSFSMIQKNAMQDVEQTRKIADELKKTIGLRRAPRGSRKSFVQSTNKDIDKQESNQRSTYHAQR